MRNKSDDISYAVNLKFIHNSNLEKIDLGLLISILCVRSKISLLDICMVRIFSKTCSTYSTLPKHLKHRILISHCAYTLYRFWPVSFAFLANKNTELGNADRKHLLVVV